MKLSDFLQGVGRPVAYYPGMARMLGDVKEAVFLCQLAYWKDKGEDPDGWIYKTAEEIEEETALSYKEQTGVRDGLKEKKLLEEYYARTEHKMYFRVDWDAVNELWEKYAETEHLTKGNMPRKQKPKGNMPPSQKGDGSTPNGNSLNSNTESTTDITQKNKDPFLKIISHLAPSVFGNNMTTWWEVRRRLEDNGVTISGEVGQPNPDKPVQIVIGGLNQYPKGGQFSEAEIWHERFYRAFANLGLEIAFQEAG